MSAGMGQSDQVSYTCAPPLVVACWVQHMSLKKGLTIAVLRAAAAAAPLALGTSLDCTARGMMIGTT